MSEVEGRYSPLENKYGISTANVLDKAVIYGTLWGIDQHVSIAHSAGYDGIELWPTKPNPLKQIRAGQVNEADLRSILSAHQSPRTVSFQEAITHPSQLPLAIFLPELQRSLQDLEAVAKITGDIPIVLYKETPEEFHRKTDLQNRLIQPDPEVVESWDVKSAQDFVDKMLSRGFTGICLDTNHLRRNHRVTNSPSVLANWKESIPTFLANNAIKEIHVGVGRTDLPAIDKITSIDEVTDLLNGTRTTDAIKILELVAESGWKGDIILEVLPSSIQVVLGKKGVFLSKNDLVESYNTIRENLYRLFDK